MQTFTFSSNRKKPIFGDVNRSAEVNRWLRKTLSEQLGRESLLSPLVSEFEVEGERVSFLIDATDEVQFIEIGTLGDTNPERVRELRYAFRDWRKEVLSTILGTQAYAEIGLTEAEMSNNTSLLRMQPCCSLMRKATRWCGGVALVLIFRTTAHNFLPDEAGHYVMNEVAVHAMQMESNQEEVQIQRLGDWNTRKPSSELHSEYSLPSIFLKGGCSHFWSWISPGLHCFLHFFGDEALRFDGC